MEQLKKTFKINVSQDKMVAQINRIKDDDHTEQQITEADIREFLMENDVTYGIIEEAIHMLVYKASKVTYPLTIAEGKQPIHGKDGQVHYHVEFNPVMVRDEVCDFRDVMRIPSVKKGEKIATLIPPTEGKNGMNVSGAVVPSIPGKPAAVKEGKNVVFREADQGFYATSEGQLNKQGRFIQVLPIFEVQQTLSMKTGNLDFIGTIIIHGDVPAGYTVKAKGDVKIFGMVEAASVTAGGSVYISEGLAGQGTGSIHAAESIHIGYINQGNIVAGQDLFVENSIFHSQCTVAGHVFCQRGSIVGGTISVGNTVEAKDVGNRVGVKTEIMFGVDHRTEKQEQKLLDEKKELEATLSKLALLEKKIQGQQVENDPKLKITLLRYKHSWNKTEERLKKVEQAIRQLTSKLGSGENGALIVRNYLYTNVVVAFGKYYRVSKADYQRVKVQLVDNEIVTYPLSDN
ncbi:FapA family protein [Virgibacillus pantothenticus]|uniref:DUF342 domain-containing protein n=1 Tax=Virgibacillus pantothenticus TaxID=1473 RepID=UPI001C232593|nr:FapA family protein [Virgibacillus pantothenticus]MBU8565965.1 FapA family protein [Virgibacillus pantothenticus]MBU8600942.1 FapA family protein [Virgibacillus pantothenticus]MBU8633055.1 FapA family protein [Virgibacillus pantothenticus]MBU8643092.1 FapA family protein [Virgibacillus pantothenticus]MBU8647256.1 FapA family protein [Virgibacillus pantothenticus]